ncbi:hypothetical protein J2S74_005498 [Evansella vedderi]|uniref:Uncharacterized protein n=1 Tax=Evansella vedderi TaxID=38282 RepID=A0ABU0A449_9BACI|nr:hypothetical protein [Evansella vedderi]MDQ0258035.1 hypothetical protein [Evansella vedderi]
MKQFFPFILIAGIVGAAMFFLSDNYEEERFDPYYSFEERSMYWEYTVFLEDVSEEVPEIGVRLHFINENKKRDINALEFFVETDYGGFYYQDLDINDFNGEIIYTEPCDFCLSNGRLNVYGNIYINWRENDEIYSDWLHFHLRYDN